MDQAMTPAVSIILPTFNRLELLPATIESVLAQTFSDWELIICDDGSEPPTRQYLSSLESDPRIRVHFLERTGRPSVVRNVGLRAARGELIAFQDSDDLWRPEKLQVQVASLRAKSHCRWGLTRFILVDRELAPTRWSVETGGWPAVGGWIFGELLRARTVVALPSVLVEAAALRELNGFDESLETSEDFDLWLRLAQLSEVDAVDEPLTLVRRHQDHFSGRGARDFINSQKVMEKLRRCGVPSDLAAVLRRRETDIAVGLCAHFATRGHSAAAVGIVRDSFGKCWRDPVWWIGLAKNTARLGRRSLSTQPSARL
jgi:glycosyltransferase involved in cell wall biosynthesis